MHSFIVFEVSNKQPEVEAEMLRNGYWTRWLDTGKKTTIYLPRNCFWKPNIELATAKNELNGFIDRLNVGITNPDERISILRCVVLSVNPWDGIPGTPK